MRKIVILLAICILLPLPVQAYEYIAPPVPESGEAYMPENTESFGQGIWEIMKDGIMLFKPAVYEALHLCAWVLIVALLLSIVNNMTFASTKTISLVGTVTISGLLFASSKVMVGLATSTIKQLSDYGKILIPVMTGAMAASGGAGTAASLYSGTVIFDSILSSIISLLLVPLVYIYLAMSVASNATGEGILKQLQDFVKWIMTWLLKIILYVFTGYMGITKVVSGSTDAAALKATKLTISGMVPIVGGILSDASESVIVSAGLMRNAAGIYGILAICAVALEPFLNIGVQYLMLKVTAEICSLFAPKDSVGLIRNFSSAMGFLLAMTGSVCLMLLISIVCFLKGVS